MTVWNVDSVYCKLTLKKIILNLVILNMQLKAAKVKGCEKITEWSEPIRNHFWFVCQNCKGDLENLKVILSSLGYT